jgi:hypothetical protein
MQALQAEQSRESYCEQASAGTYSLTCSSSPGCSRIITTSISCNMLNTAI